MLQQTCAASLSASAAVSFASCSAATSAKNASSTAKIRLRNEKKTSSQAKKRISEAKNAWSQRRLLDLRGRVLLRLRARRREGLAEDLDLTIQTFEKILKSETSKSSCQ